uniref:von Willebrand factor A domain-containing protein 2 n=1 Tax=Dromaius novaehollandiae TaxID=8790 RepID=A0A8C4JQD9_DRONO|nr:von Willebrand factor A domain-containing protein 2 [Dromaius novaehollandiae]XP_025951972.1 von Willebrand factor A domain-containing protein 2 [Dromaius novaehollandiae]XP_025951973.1 von Willebrand factor A domain-containing protein 2 [Dromaius novaehollandiae]XP_025951974.1 von Willebrand factor A domain-containing protein 2 [Dromaius novaehollandiae]XP_025951975.1 von Willebrand factor A domain-containing protein 2 [Dromaius novaehollandiae]XP_025951976.1 von Willebrand factor A domain
MNLLLSFESICILLLPQVLLVFGIQEIHADQEMIVKISAAGQLMQCSASVDILFLLDGSYSIGKGSFERSKHFTGKLCDALDISPDRVRVGMIQFSSTPRLEFSLDSYRTKQEVKERIKKTMFRGGSTETGLALKYVLHKGFPGGRNSTVPEILIILSDGKSQGNTEIPAMQVKERGTTVFAVGIKFPRWEELHALASEPTEQHVLFAGDATDAANGFYSTLTGSSVCSTPSPDCKIESHPCERKTLETVEELAGNYVCWKGSKQQNAVHASLCPFYRWKRIFIKHPSRCFRTVCPGPCDSQPCQNGGTCVPEGLDKYHCLCPMRHRGDIHCAPKLSLECRVDLLFLMDSSAGIMLEGFLCFKAFLKRFLQAVMGQDSPMNVGVAQYGTDVKIPIEVGQHKDVFGLMKSIEALNFSGGGTLTGRALWYIAQHGFRSTPVFADVQDDLPRVVVLLTDSKSQDPVAEAAKYARDRGLFLISIGSSFLRAELAEVTGNPKQTIVYSSPQDLFNKIPELQKRICSVDNPEGCQAQSLDLVFAVDASARVGLENFLQLRDFVRSCSFHFTINRDVTQIGLVVYGSKAHIVFALDTHTSNSALLQAINQLPFLGGSASAGSALLRIYGDVMTVQKGARPGVNKVVVMLTNGGGMEDAASPAWQLRNNGILVFVVVIGDAQRDMLLRVAGSPNYLLHISSYKDLQHYEDLIIERICEEAKSPVNLCKPNPCMNQGVCILGPGSYRCKCHGWEGPHCESRIVRGDSPRSLVLPPDSHVQQSPRGLQHFSRAPRHTEKHVDWKH